MSALVPIRNCRKFIDKNNWVQIEILFPVKHKTCASLYACLERPLAFVVLTTNWKIIELEITQIKCHSSSHWSYSYSNLNVRRQHTAVR